MFSLKFGMVESILRALHGLGDDKKVAFESRLRHLQRLGLTPAVKTGKGTRGSYGVRELLNLALALELIELGLHPERAVEIILSAEDKVRDGFGRSLQSKKVDAIFLGVDPRGLQDGKSKVEVLTESRLGEAFRADSEDPVTRMSLISLSTLVEKIAGVLEAYRALFVSTVLADPLPQLRPAIRDWCILKGRN